MAFTPSKLLFAKHQTTRTLSQLRQMVEMLTCCKFCVWVGVSAILTSGSIIEKYHLLGIFAVVLWWFVFIAFEMSYLLFSIRHDHTLWNKKCWIDTLLTHFELHLYHPTPLIPNNKRWASNKVWNVSNVYRSRFDIIDFVGIIFGFCVGVLVY